MDIYLLIFLVLVFVLLIITKRKPPFEITQEGIRVNGPLNKLIDFSEIRELRRITRDELGIGMRIGLQMPDQSVGVFRFSSLGVVYMNTNSDRKMVLIATDNENIIISPEDPDEFITTLHKS